LIWCHSKDGCFSKSNAYSLFFAANRSFPCARPIWKSKAPPRCKFFMWLVVHQRWRTISSGEDGLTLAHASGRVLKPVLICSSIVGSPLRSGANLEPGRRQPSVPPVRASTPQRTGGLKRGSRSPSRCDVTLTPLSSWYIGRFGRKETQEFLRVRNTQLRRFLMASGTTSLSGDLLA
jgi:hypothetical protein